MIQIIKDKDFESYKIQIPLFQMFGRRRKRYVFQQLEKIHPCFSDRCSVDMKYFLNKKGFGSSVVVMDKVVLADYKAEYPGASLQIEKGKTVYRKQNLYLYIFLLFLMVISFSVVVLITKKPEEKLVIENSSEKLITDEKNQQKECLLNDFLSFTEGSIKQIYWNYDGLNEVLSATVSDCFPSDFEKFQTETNISFSPVVISNNKPEFSFQINRNVKKNMESEVEKAETDKRNLFSKNIRECLLKNGFVLESETYSPYKLQFYEIRKMNFFDESFLKILVSISDQYSFFCNGVRISLSGNKKINYELSYIRNDQDLFFESPLIKISSSKEKFMEKKKVNETSIQEVKRKTVSESAKKIGSISHEEGHMKEFYKNEKGKIINEEK